MTSQKPKQGYKLVKSLFGKYEEIPEEWNLQKLDDVGEIIGGGTPESNKEKFWNGDILWAVPTDITKQSTKFIDHTERMISKKGLQESSAKLLPEGTLLITTRATIGECSISKKSISTNQGFQNLICNKDNFNEFWYYAIKYHRKRLLRLSYGTTFLEISKSGMKQVSIPTTNSKTEQQKIAFILSNIDNLIDSYDETIQTTKKLKKGLMQQLLTKGIGHKKFKKVKWHFRQLVEIPEDWNLVLLHDVCDKQDNVNVKSKLYVGIENIESKSGVLLFKSDVNKFLIRKPFKSNNVLYSKLRPYLEKVWLADEDGFCSSDIYPLKSNKTILSSFLLKSLLSDQFLKFANATTAGGNIPKTRWNDIKLYKLILPPISEQKKIISILNGVDEKLLRLSKKKLELDRIKSGLMQKLLTGQIRV